MIDQIILKPYNKNWHNQALTEIGILKQNCQFSWLKDIQHIGSTAIIGLKAKPVIDIMIGVSELTKAKQIIPVLESMKYTFWAENSKTDRLFFIKGLPPSAKKRTHHVHIFEINSETWHIHQVFRDYLNNHPSDKLAYQKIKINLAKKFLNDREQYTNGKSEFIQSIIIKALNYIPQEKT